MTLRRGRVAVVTGGGSGVGMEIARTLGEEGYAVAILGRSQNRLEEAESLLENAVPHLALYQGDVRDVDAVDAILREVEATLGPIDVVVHAAGVCAALGPTWAVEQPRWEADLDTGVKAAYLLIRRVIPGMIDRGRGRMVAVNSYAAFRPAPNQSGYAAGKAALASLIASLDAELEGTGVRAFSVTPGFVRTAMTSAMAETPWFSALADREDALPPERVARLVARIARGDADRLSGRVLHALDDLDELLARLDEINAEDLYSPRLRRLDSPGTS
jgi:NAD(P)-dependent dehydrogenase (short-subunit alcohol dehydrogenase family)